jgi:hypothetical protein
MTSPFVPVYRQFPSSDPHNLEKQLVNFHTQSNTAINQRTIGIFELYTPPEAAPSNAPAPSVPNGERWFPDPNASPPQTRQRDGNRLVVQVSDSVLTVVHNIVQINQGTRLYGMFKDGSGVWWPLPYVDLVNVNNQIQIKVTSTQIIVVKGAGAPPSINLGIVVFEYV